MNYIKNLFHSVGITKGASSVKGNLRDEKETTFKNVQGRYSVLKECSLLLGVVAKIICSFLLFLFYINVCKF